MSFENSPPRRARPHSRAAGRALLLAALILSFSSWADPVADARRLSANPDSTVLGLSWVQHLRGQLGATLPAWGDDDTSSLTVRIPAMVELSNEVNNAVPNNDWRGLLSLEVGYHFNPSSTLGSRAAVSLEIHHESDHTTVDLLRGVGTPGSTHLVGDFQVNTVGVRGDVPWIAWGQQFVVSLLPRLHVLSCTKDPVLCARGTDGWGSQAFEALVEAMWTGSGSPPEPGHFRPFASMSGDLIFPNGLVAREARLNLDAGTWVRTRKRGEFQFYALAWFGNQAGFLRQETIATVGGGFRWTM
jgi:hypothetical protein